jgi:hypothetical protein
MITPEWGPLINDMHNTVLTSPRRRCAPLSPHRLHAARPHHQAGRQLQVAAAAAAAGAARSPPLLTHTPSLSLALTSQHRR